MRQDYQITPYGDRDEHKRACLGGSRLCGCAGGIQNSAGQSKPSNLGRTDSGALEFTPTAASASSNGAFGRQEGEPHG